MHRRLYVAPLAAALLAACSTDVVAPLKAPTASKFAVSVDGGGSYVVTANGNKFPATFAAKVASLGGSLTYVNDKAGFALVNGLSAGAASQLGALGGISGVLQDDAFKADFGQSTAEADATSLGEPVANSVANPAGGVRFSWQWNMRLIGADVAWAHGHLGDEGVTVAILDTGLDYNIPDLNGLVDLSRSTSFMDTYFLAPGEKVRHLSDNATTTKFFSTRNPVTDYNGHGTNVATQVSSKAPVHAGVTSKTTLIGVKVLGSNGSGTTGTVLAGVLWAADHGADVANMSLGGGFGKSGAGSLVSIINKVFNYAHRAGMLIVVSAGNSGADLQHNGNFESTYCDSPHVICVSAVGPTTFTANPDLPAFYTNYGRGALDVAAPGGTYAADAKGNPVVDKDGNIVVSPWPWGLDFASWVWSYCAKNRITSWTISGTTAADTADVSKHTPVAVACAAGNRVTGYIGTSQASPHVAGLAAMLVAEKGHGIPDDIKDIILSSAAPVNPLIGRGRISVSNALGL
jgi:lantibiotic leader peptide-processing serine protease